MLPNKNLGPDRRPKRRAPLESKDASPEIPVAPQQIKALIERAFAAAEHPGDGCLVDSVEGDEPARVADLATWIIRSSAPLSSAPVRLHTA
ncbi:MAG: hypothetical protein JNK49_04625 [Planctomycetes bacterium]|nr:hypothetical protein [Planctomycetota bacterium]